jgi:hypothetical protein
MPGKWLDRGSDLVRGAPNVGSTAQPADSFPESPLAAIIHTAPVSIWEMSVDEVTYHACVYGCGDPNAGIWPDRSNLYHRSLSIREPGG